ncbi:MAG: SCO family protein, partial [Deltaproteobacteria bacterium]|nr:SCO family protein [Deltaproteobacteria bacterium]
MRLREPLLRRLLWGLLAVALAGAAGAALWTREAATTRQGTSEERPLEGLKVFGTVPDFSLIERNGRRVALGDLRGKVWVANFIYTHCLDTCPLQS